MVWWLPKKHMLERPKQLLKSSLYKFCITILIEISIQDPQIWGKYSTEVAHSRSFHTYKMLLDTSNLQTYKDVMEYVFLRKLQNNVRQQTRSIILNMSCSQEEKNINTYPFLILSTSVKIKKLYLCPEDKISCWSYTHQRFKVIRG